ncbi:MAG: GGDEF domain-containing protein [Alphaproteobacteria bacterium]|nr:MAG: GGDEF domain-containing protein [Alphaproteobacteria bacterium]
MLLSLHSMLVEARFDLEGLVQRKHIGRIALIVGMLVYDAAIIMDWQVIPDMVVWLAFLRFGVFTAMVLFVLWLLPRTTAIWQFDAMIVVGTIVGVTLPTVAMVFSRSEHVLLYQFGTTLTLTYFTLVQRVRFRFAAVGLAVAFGVQFACLRLRSEIDATEFGFVVNFYLSGAALLLMGSYILERSERQAFLERLRSELLLEQIEKTARTDSLTGLSNRHHLTSVREAIAAGLVNGCVSVLMIDIDHFKRFNDTQGHLAGDHCIRAVAQLIRDSLDSHGATLSGHAFRYGGEEFLLLLPGRDAAHAAMLGETISQRLAAARIAHPAAGEGAMVTVSIGVAGCCMAGFSLDVLIDTADHALYRAKQEGRDRLVIAA